MNAAVAWLANHDALIEFCLGEVLFEARSAVQFARDQMMERQRHDAMTKHAGIIGAVHA